MPLYDQEQDRLILRIVYDGPGVAGKTTNVEKLCEEFQRAGELFDAGRINGRTQYFECMHVDGGTIVGHRLRSVFMTVPGQRELRERRMALIDQADAIVFVCDSSEAGLPRAREMYEDLRRHLETTQRSNLPILVQANKQDCPGALDTNRVRRGVGVEPDVAVMPARALMGVGVREAAVAATRSAAVAARRAIEERGREAISSETGTFERLVASLKSIPSGPSGDAVDPLLAAVGDLGRPAADPPESPANADREPDAPPPRLPSAEVRALRVWPALSGPDVISGMLQSGVPVLRTDRSEMAGARGTAHVFEVGHWCVRTHAGHRFFDEEALGNKLVELAQATRRLGRFAPARCTLCVTEALDEARWVWTIHPWMRTFSERLSAATSSGDASRAASIVTEFGKAAVGLLQVALSEGLVLNLAPTALGSAESRVTYLGDAVPGDAGSMSRSLLENLSECEAALQGAVEPAPGMPPELAALSLRERASLREALASVDAPSAQVEVTQTRWVDLLSA